MAGLGCVSLFGSGGVREEVGYRDAHASAKKWRFFGWVILQCEHCLPNISLCLRPSVNYLSIYLSAYYHYVCHFVCLSIHKTCLLCALKYFDKTLV